MSFLVNWKLYMGNYTHIWRKRWQPTPIFLPRESCGRRSRWAAVHRVAQSQTRLKWLSMRACIGEGNGNPFQCSCLDNPRDGGAQWLLSMRSHRVGHNWSDLACVHALEKEMATHSSILAWRIPGTEEPGGLLSMGLHRVGYDWSNLEAVANTRKGEYLPSPSNKC